MLTQSSWAHPGHRVLIAAVIAALCLVSGLGLIRILIVSQRSAPHPTVASDASGGNWPEVIGPVLGSSEPVRLEIPSIGVDSMLQHLGLTTDGELEVPVPGPHYNDAAWYRDSPTPGELGPAVLLGHYDSAAEGPSVFFDLGQLQDGDPIAITRADHTTAQFTVDAVHRYAKDDFPTDLVYGDIDHAGLRILTCGGAFDRTTGHYADNVVVFASLTDSSVPATALRVSR